MDLLGWDIAFVGGIETVNKALAAHATSLIQSFDAQHDGAAAHGVFGAWSVAPRGSGTLLHLRLPLISGQFVPQQGAAAVDIAGLNVVLQISLRWLDRQTEPQVRELAMDLRQAAAEGTEDPSSISFISLLPAGRLTPFQARRLGHMIAAYIAAHAAQVSFALATIDPAASSASWLHPSSSVFSFLNSNDGSAASLAVLSTVQPKDTSALPRSLGPELSPSDASGGAFGITAALVLRNMIGPALAAALSIPPERVTPAPGQTVSIAGPIVLPTNSSKQPVLNSVVATLRDSRVTVAYHGSIDAGPGVRIDFTVTCIVEGSVLPNPLAVIFQTISVTSEKVVQKEWWVSLSEAILGGLATAALDRFLEDAATTIVNLIGQYLGDRTRHPVDLAPILWSGGSRFIPRSGSFADGLIVQGGFA